MAKRDLSLAGEALAYFKEGKPLSEEHALALTRDRILNPRGDIYFGGESLTDQSQAADCDINNIMAQYTMTGDVRGVRESYGMYGDFSDIGDYAEALERVRVAEELFNALPGKVRREFGDNPQEMLNFVADVKNRGRAIELGLIDPPPKPADPMLVRVVPEKDPPK